MYQINVVVYVSMIPLDRYFILININGISFLFLYLERELIIYKFGPYYTQIQFVLEFLNIHQHFSNLTHNTGKAMAPRSSTLAWKIPWTEESGGLQSMGSLRVRHD